MATKPIPFGPIEQLDRETHYYHKYLATQIQDVVALNLWKPFKLISHNLKISHLLFADDILLFTQADNTSLQTIKDVYDQFCNSSGMEINIEKSRLWISPNLEEHKKENILKFPTDPCHKPPRELLMIPNKAKFYHK